jgi:hypothetical protein
MVTNGGYCGAGGTMNIKGLFPNEYATFTIDMFLIVATYVGSDNQKNSALDISGKATYDASTGVLQLNQVAGGSDGNLYAGYNKIYLVKSDIVMLA